MIVTLTPNPSLDRTLEIDRLVRGEVLRATRASVEPGGKGINVSRALQANGHATRAVLPLGGRGGEQLGDALRASGLEVVAVPIAEPVRTNISLVEADATVTKVNAPGPQLTADDVTALVKATIDACDGAAWLVCSGSLPPGAPDDLYATLVREGHAAGVRVAVDTSGPSLVTAVDAGPDLLKPNVHELAAATGRRLETLGDVAAAARLLLLVPDAVVVVSLGADGALLVPAIGEVLHGGTPPVTARSAVGAGDALLAGVLSTLPAPRAQGDSRSSGEALRTGVAYGTAAAQLPGTQMPGPGDLDPTAVTVIPAPLDRPLTEPGGTP